MTGDRGQTLLAIARGAIAERVGEPAPPFEAGEWLRELGATFVTLTKHGELRGCIGTLIPERPLRDDVEINARSAAFRDPRFNPLSRAEYPEIQIEVSLLSRQEPLAFVSESHLRSLLRPGLDGVVLEYRGRRGTFLPQVWEQLPDPGHFLAHLKQKARLQPDFWSQDIQVSRYTVDKWREQELAAVRK